MQFGCVEGKQMDFNSFKIEENIKKNQIKKHEFNF